MTQCQSQSARICAHRDCVTFLEPGLPIHPSGVPPPTHNRESPTTHHILCILSVCVCVSPPRREADAGDAAAGFDFGDAARMAAEFAPILGGAPAGQRGH